MLSVVDYNIDVVMTYEPKVSHKISSVLVGIPSTAGWTIYKPIKLRVWAFDCDTVYSCRYVPAF